MDWQGEGMKRQFHNAKLDARDKITFCLTTEANTFA
jgi:hypothetical protein